MWRHVSLMVVGLSLTACAASTTTTSRSSFAKTGRDVLTAAEIVAARVTDAYQAVVQLRPEFLRHRGGFVSPTIAPVSVAIYLDELPFGSAESLRYIPLDRVRTIRYVSPALADLRWGGTHAAGAILVTTLR